MPGLGAGVINRCPDLTVSPDRRVEENQLHASVRPSGLSGAGGCLVG